MPWVSLTDFHTTNLVDVNWTVTVIIKLRLPLPPKVLMTPRILAPCAPSWTRTIVADGHTFAAVRRLRRRLLDRSKNNFTYPTCIWRPGWVWCHRNFVQIFCIKKTKSLWAIVRRCLRDPKFSCFGTMHAGLWRTVRQRDRQTDRHATTANTALA